MKAVDILEGLGLNLGTATKSWVIEIHYASDAFGTIQADQMVQLFPSRPEMHTTCDVRRALIEAGCTPQE